MIEGDLVSNESRIHARARVRRHYEPEREAIRLITDLGVQVSLLSFAGVFWAIVAALTGNAVA